MQVGNLSRTHVPHERHDNPAFQAMRVLLVIGLMSAGWLALWRFQGISTTTEGIVAAAPPQTITVEPQVPNPPDRRPARVQAVDADPSAPVMPAMRPVSASSMEADLDDSDPASTEPGIDSASVELSHGQSLAVLKQFKAVVEKSSQTEAGKPLPAPRTDMNMTGTVTQQASVVQPPAPSAASGSVVDLNKGSLEELNTLKGAGSLGRAILRGRPYKSVEDLVKKRVVRRTAFERIKDQVAVR